MLINVLANDSDPEGSALNIVALTQPAAGQGSVSITGGQLSYTPPASVSVPTTVTFTYRAQDVAGAQSAVATVTVQVSPAAVQETFTVDAAAVQLRLGNRATWSFNGTSSRMAGNTVTVQVTTSAGLVELGSAPVLANGRWRLSATSTQLPSANPTATITSSVGTVRTVPITVQ